MAMEAIKPKHKIEAPKISVLEAELTRFARQVTDEAKRYPPWRPWKNPPKSGRRAGGRRTGDLGRSWDYKVELGGDAGYVEVKSEGAKLERPYNKFVQGDEQTSVMAGRGWRTIDEIAEQRQSEFTKRCQAWAVVIVKS